MEENISAARLAARRDVAQKSIAQLRKRRLDLSNRNRLLNFKFSDRSSTHARVIDELPDVLYSKLVDDGKRLTFTALPEPQNEPQDEKSEEFLEWYENDTSDSRFFAPFLLQQQLGQFFVRYNEWRQHQALHYQTPASVYCGLDV